jgi:hypothetical protein
MSRVAASSYMLCSSKDKKSSLPYKDEGRDCMFRA